MTAPWPRAIVFDFDNVLVNSEPLHFWAFQQVLKEEGIELSEAEYYQECIGFDDKGAFKRIFEKYNKTLDPKTQLRVLTHKKLAMLEQIRTRKYAALPGVEQFVRGVWRNYPLAICSGALTDEIELMLEGVSLRDCFSVIVAAEDVTVGKPDPQGYLLATKLISQKIKRDLSPQDVLIVEDAPNVIREARQVGFSVLGVANSYTPEKLSDANYVAKSLDCDEIQRLIPVLQMTRA